MALRAAVPCIVSLKVALYLWIPKSLQMCAAFQFLPTQNSQDLSVEMQCNKLVIGMVDVLLCVKKDSYYSQLHCRWVLFT